MALTDHNLDWPGNLDANAPGILVPYSAAHFSSLRRFPTLTCPLHVTSHSFYRPVSRLWTYAPRFPASALIPKWNPPSPITRPRVRIDHNLDWLGNRDDTLGILVSYFAVPFPPIRCSRSPTVTCPLHVTSHSFYWPASPLRTYSLGFRHRYRFPDEISFPLRVTLGTNPPVLSQYMLSTWWFHVQNTNIFLNRNMLSSFRIH